MKNVCIIGSGKQGTAAAYDILLYAKPKKMLLLDLSPEALDICKRKIKNVVNSKTSIDFKVIDFKDQKSLIKILKDFDIMLSAVPYPLNPLLTKIALKSEISMVDLGGHTKNVIKQLSYHDKAIENLNKALNIISNNY